MTALRARGVQASSSDHRGTGHGRTCRTAPRAAGAVAALSTVMEVPSFQYCWLLSLPFSTLAYSGHVALAEASPVPMQRRIQHILLFLEWCWNFLSFCSNNISAYRALIHDIITVWFVQHSCRVSCFVLHVWISVSFLKYKAVLLLLLNFGLMTSDRFACLLSLEDRTRIHSRVLADSSSSALFINCINMLFHHRS